jgi:hypothetical protein
VEAPAEPIDLDDVARPDSLESHRWQAYARPRRTLAAARGLSPTTVDGLAAACSSDRQRDRRLLKYLLVVCSYP